MKHLYKIIVVGVLLVIGCAPKSNEPAEKPVKIIFDTDMGPDYDDVGAIGVLHALANLGECEILATVSSDGHKSIAPTIELFNRYFGSPNIPVGEPLEGAPNFTAKNHWNDSLLLHESFSKLVVGQEYPSAVSVYRKVLAAQDDASVTIVTVGFLSNLASLLTSAPDDYSPLGGRELVQKKVDKLVAMAGVFPQGREFNVFKDAESAKYAFENWPTPILFSGFEIGKEIHTGGKLAENGSKDNPLAWAYQYNLKTYQDPPQFNRQSWDQTAVLAAVRDPEKYFYVNGPGKYIALDEGNNSWNPDQDAGHYFLTHKYPYHYVEDVLDELMMFEP
ncbi:nucleoside hydrolase [Arenibacter palladensis]|uniref:nucleoside hydrolase n=1 Tax=Arenibacter palladensis TaxID=237373 RepID=UPI002FD67600